VINEVIGLYDQFGNSDYIGEAISQIEHMCQAAMLAEAEGHDDEVILAAFFMISGIFAKRLCLLNQWMDLG